MGVFGVIGSLAHVYRVAARCNRHDMGCDLSYTQYGPADITHLNHTQNTTRLYAEEG